MVCVVREMRRVPVSSTVPSKRRSSSYVAVGHCSSNGFSPKLVESVHTSSICQVPLGSPPQGEKSRATSAQADSSTTSPSTMMIVNLEKWVMFPVTLPPASEEPGTSVQVPPSSTASTAFLPLGTSAVKASSSVQGTANCVPSGPNS